MGHVGGSRVVGWMVVMDFDEVRRREPSTGHVVFVMTSALDEASTVPVDGVLG